MPAFFFKFCYVHLLFFLHCVNSVYGFLCAIFDVIVRSRDVGHQLAGEARGRGKGARQGARQGMDLVIVVYSWLL